MTCFAPVLAALALAAPAPEDKKVDYQKEADAATWEWSPERANVQDSIERCKGPYRAEATPRMEGVGGVTIRFSKDGKEVHSWEGSAATVFAVRGSVLYLADFSQFSTGCAVVAYDLAARKQLWKTGLKGLGPIAHTKYRNQVTLDLKRDAILVHGKESAGNYIEYVDLGTGKTVGHKVFSSR